MNRYKDSEVLTDIKASIFLFNFQKWVKKGMKSFTLTINLLLIGSYCKLISILHFFSIQGKFLSTKNVS